MKYSLRIHINSNNQGLLNAVKNVIPDVDNPIVVDGGYNIQEGSIDDINYFMADIQFKEMIDRDIILQSIKGLNGVIHSCLSGSKVLGYIKNHEEGLPCEIETILEKD